MQTAQEYHEYLSQAYTFFNEKLFEQTFNVTLPEVVITLAHKNTARGYYWHNIFNDKINEVQVPELAICFNSLKNDTKTILSTLCHEMCHVLEYYLGTNSPPPYHNKKWALTMLAIGLFPYSITDSSKMTGTKVSHTVVNNGVFDILADEFIKEHGEFALAQNNELVHQTVTPNKRPLVICPECKNKLSIPKSLNVKVICKDCNKEMASEN